MRLGRAASGGSGMSMNANRETARSTEASASSRAWASMTRSSTFARPCAAAPGDLEHARRLVGEQHASCGPTRPPTRRPTSPVPQPDVEHRVARLRVEASSSRSVIGRAPAETHASRRSHPSATLDHAAALSVAHAATPVKRGMMSLP